MKKVIAWVGVIVILFAGSVWWSKNLQKNDPDIISRSGLHWHPIVEIYVKGAKQEIPPDLGIGITYSNFPAFDSQMNMTPIHTHDDATEGIVHLEFPGIVRRDDTKLGNFFEIWGKDINSFGSNVRMIVNGAENTELGVYFMQDGDKIELRYE